MSVVFTSEIVSSVGFPPRRVSSASWPPVPHVWWYARFPLIELRSPVKNSASRRVGGGHSLRVAAPSSLAVRTLPAACALPAVPLPVAQCNGSSSQIFIVLSWGVGTYLV